MTYYQEEIRKYLELQSWKKYGVPLEFDVDTFKISKIVGEYITKESRFGCAYMPNGETHWTFHFIFTEIINGPWKAIDFHVSQKTMESFPHVAKQELLAFMKENKLSWGKLYGVSVPKKIVDELLELSELPKP